MNKSGKEVMAAPYEKWLAAQVMQCVLRTGKYPLKTTDSQFVQRIIDEIKRKWGLSCRVDYDKSDLLPKQSYTITLENAGLPIGQEKLIHLLEILKDLLLNGYSVVRDINDYSVQEDVRLFKEYFQIDCTVRLNEGTKDNATYLIVRA